MSINELQQQTTVNVQEKANLIWAIADKLVGVYKPHEYGNVILPMCVVKCSLSKVEQVLLAAVY